jgi:hypothetical protein
MDRGADVNAYASTDEAGIGGQTPIFHAVTQFRDWGLPVVRLLLDRGADLSVRAKLPECTPLGYALRYPGDELPNTKTISLLRERGAAE